MAISTEELCGYEWCIADEPYMDASCELPRGHHGDHKEMIEYTHEPEMLGPKYYAPGEWEKSQEWKRVWEELWLPVLKAQFQYVQSLNTSELTSPPSETERSVVRFTTTDTPVQASGSTTSSASPATPTGTQ